MLVPSTDRLQAIGAGEMKVWACETRPCGGDPPPDPRDDVVQAPVDSAQAADVPDGQYGRRHHLFNHLGGEVL